MGAEAEWEHDAENWVRWARTPGFDAYWYFRDGFFDGIVPKAGRRTLEIGCGEGRVSRDLAARGHSVVAVDGAQTLVRHAVAEDPVSAYAMADGAALPFPDGSFDLVVAYNALQVVADMPGTVSEAGRVLDRGGCMCACVVHPVTDLGRFIDDADARFMLRPDYFDTQRVDDTVERDDHTMTFRGWTYSLEQYAMALERAGLRIDSLREPRPTAGVDTYARWRRIPLFLNLRAAKA